MFVSFRGQTDRQRDDLFTPFMFVKGPHSKPQLMADKTEIYKKIDRLTVLGHY